jgi:hypothetical protein
MVAADAAAAARTFATASALYTVALTVPPEDPLAHAELLERAAIAAGWAGTSSVALLRATLADARFREAGQAWRAPAMWLNPTLRHLPKPPLDVPMSEGGDIAALLVAAERACLDHDHPRARPWPARRSTWRGNRAPSRHGRPRLRTGWCAAARWPRVKARCTNSSPPPYQATRCSCRAARRS